MQQPKNFSTYHKYFDPSPKSYDWSTSTSGFTNNPKHNNSKYEIGKQPVNKEVEAFECHKANHPLNDVPQKILFSEDGFELAGEHILEGECFEDEYDDHLILSSEDTNVQSIDQLVTSDEFSIDELNNQVTLPQEESIQPTPSTEIITSLLDSSTISGDFSLSLQDNDLHKTPVLQFLTQLDDKYNQVMNGISIPAIPKENITLTKFKIFLQPQPYMFSWINQTAIINSGCDVLRTITKGYDFRMKEQSLFIPLVEQKEIIESLVVDLPTDLPLLSTFKLAFPDEVPEKSQHLRNILYASVLFLGDTLFKLPQFWDTLWHKTGTLRGFMSACHPQMDGHALILDRSIDSQVVKEPPDT